MEGIEVAVVRIGPAPHERDLPCRGALQAQRTSIEAPDMRKNLAERSVDVRAGTAKQFDAFLTRERAKWSVAVKESGATVD